MRALRKRGTDEIFPWAPVLSEREDMEEGEYNPESKRFTSAEKKRRGRTVKPSPGPDASPAVNDGSYQDGEEEELLEEEAD